jgi:ribosomal protein S3
MATDLSAAVWRTSSYSGANGDCVEVAGNLGGAVAVRDSKDRTGPVLLFTPGEWDAFVSGLKNGGTRLG